MFVNANSIVQRVNQIKNGIIKHQCVCECKNYRKFKKDYSWNRMTCICENNKYLKIISDDFKIVCNKLHLLWIFYQQK